MAILHNLPSPTFDPVRNSMHGMQITPRFDVLTPTNINVQIIKTKQLVFQNGSNLIFQNIAVPFIAVYAHDWFFDVPFKIGYSSNLNFNGSNGSPPVPTPPTPA